MMTESQYIDMCHKITTGCVKIKIQGLGYKLNDVFENWYEQLLIRNTNKDYFYAGMKMPFEIPPIQISISPIIFSLTIDIESKFIINVNKNQ